MPRRDGTGPMGMGAMTGKNAGYCNGNQANYRGRCVGGYRNSCFRFGIQNSVDEKSFLSQQEISLENQLKQVKERLSEFK